MAKKRAKAKKKTRPKARKKTRPKARKKTRPKARKKTKAKARKKTRPKRKTKATKSKKPFGGYSISFKGRKETLESVFGSAPIGPAVMTKKLWALVKRKKLGKRR